MINVCPQCGNYRADKDIDPTGPYAICPECGHAHRFLQLPLLVISGASGSGKTTVGHALYGRVNQTILLDSDILWRKEFDSPETHYRDFFETWLRMCKNISQAGRPVVLFGAGMGVPENLEPCVERRYLARIHYLALVCADETLVQRLQARPTWRGTREPAFIQEQKRFNQWFKNYDQQPGIELIDTTRSSVEETVEQVRQWIEARARPDQPR
jgi:shikimate kinase